MTTVQFVALDLSAKSGEAVKSGPIGFAIILLLCIACYFLFKSMSRHLKRVREEFPSAEQAEHADAPDSAAGSQQPADTASQTPSTPGGESAST